MMEVYGIIRAVAAATWFRPPAETSSSFFSRLAICTPRAALKAGVG
jgi:hypothetical protein